MSYVEEINDFQKWPFFGGFFDEKPLFLKNSAQNRENDPPQSKALKK